MFVFIQDQFVIIVSVPSLRKRNRGIRLTKNAVFTAVLMWAELDLGGVSFVESVVRTGVSRSASRSIREEPAVNGAACIVFTWTCTKSFWRLRPADASIIL